MNRKGGTINLGILPRTNQLCGKNVLWYGSAQAIVNNAKLTSVAEILWIEATNMVTLWKIPYWYQPNKRMHFCNFMGR